MRPFNMRFTLGSNDPPQRLALPSRSDSFFVHCLPGLPVGHPLTAPLPLTDDFPSDPERFEFLDRAESPDFLGAPSPLFQSLLLAHCPSDLPRGEPPPAPISRSAPPHPKHAHPRKTGCACSKTACLRLLCRCFSSGGFCSPLCGCVDCFNQESPAFLPLRAQAIALNKQIDKSAFSEKYKRLTEGQRFNAAGCKCRAGCRSRHCSCHKMGLGCSPICRCLRCSNSQVELNQEQVRKMKLSCGRSKGRLVIQKEPPSVTPDSPSRSAPDPHPPDRPPPVSTGVTLKLEPYRTKAIRKGRS